MLEKKRLMDVLFDGAETPISTFLPNRFSYAGRAWDSVRKSGLMMEYARLLQ